MATIKSKASVGRKKATTRRKKRVSAVGSSDTITIAGIGRYKKSTCHKNKTEAKSAAERVRSSGRKARVIKSGTGFCVYTRGAAKKRRTA